MSAFCSACGQKLREKIDFFCPICGKKISQEQGREKNIESFFDFQELKKQEKSRFSRLIKKTSRVHH